MSERSVRVCVCVCVCASLYTCSSLQFQYFTRNVGLAALSWMLRRGGECLHVPVIVLPGQALPGTVIGPGDRMVGKGGTLTGETGSRSNSLKKWLKRWVGANRVGAARERRQDCPVCKPAGNRQTEETHLLELLYLFTRKCKSLLGSN